MNVREFNFSEPAELFGGGKSSGWRTSIRYQRFDAAADAIRYAVEELSDAGARACVLEVNEDRFDHKGIRKLYNRRDYPLPRPSGEDKGSS
ncbi:MAG: hypothetical protein OEM91_14255 [Hyphomicrobiales bacterium]|nr:hypothetical protein [Hyphomicrobiales bacterium]